MKNSKKEFNPNTALQDFLKMINLGGDSYFGGGSIFADLEDVNKENQNMNN